MQSRRKATQRACQTGTKSNFSFYGIGMQADTHIKLITHEKQKDIENLMLKC
jgi:hypothetical protein